MGGYNTRCSLSRLPIQKGDKVVMLPVVTTWDTKTPNPYGAEYFYTPLAFPIYGECNGHGKIEGISTHPVNEKFLMSLEAYRETEPKMPDGTLPKALEDYAPENLTETARAYLNCLFPKKKIKWGNFRELFGTLSHGGFLVSCRKHAPDYRHAHCLTVHQGLYKSLVSDVSNRTPCGYLKTYREQIRENIPENLGKPQASIGSPTILGQRYFIDSLSMHLDGKLLETCLDTIMFQEALSLLGYPHAADTGWDARKPEYRLHAITANFIKDYIWEHTKN